MAKKKGNNYIIDKENNIAKIELRRRGKESLWSIIDLDDLDRVLKFPYTWFSFNDYENDTCYAVASKYIGFCDKKKKSTPVLLHVFILNYEGDNRVDHINHDTLDNRKSNLRESTIKNNGMNRKSKNKNNKSGYRNVCWDKKCDKWNVQLQVDGKNTVLARFPESQLEEAGEFAELMRTKYYGNFAGNT